MSAFPTGGPPSPSPLPVRGQDRTGLIAAAIIGAACLVATIGVIALTGDDLPSGSVPLGPGVRHTPGVAGVDGASTDAVPPTQLKRSFPLPPGATKSYLPKSYLMAGERAWDVRGTLHGVRAFYDRTLPRLGYSFTDPLTTTDGRGRIIGWHGSIGSDQDATFYGYLSLDTHMYDQPPGLVTIQVTIS
ncbi:MAG: hypothetical protein ACRDPQ_00515 [Nocardioidaceae bacterium]